MTLDEDAEQKDGCFFTSGEHGVAAKLQAGDSDQNTGDASKVGQRPRCVVQGSHQYSYLHALAVTVSVSTPCSEEGRWHCLFLMNIVLFFFGNYDTG